ncbi:MAG: hypothetical protein ACYC3I_19995 [Gemmataceae bacterium]
MCFRPASLALFSAFVFCVGVHAQMLPPPRVVPQQLPPPLLPLPPRHTTMVMPPVGKPIPTLPLAASPYPPPGYRPSAYQVWQNYGVTNTGWLRPRVIQVGDSGYWMYNGAPFPYVYTMPGQHMPSAAPSGAPGS